MKYSIFEPAIIIKGHNGVINVGSVEGEYTEFTLLL